MGVDWLMGKMWVSGVDTPKTPLTTRTPAVLTNILLNKLDIYFIYILFWSNIVGNDLI